MAKQINTSIHIKANPEIVWGILTDFEKYPDWNPFIHSVKGEVKVGNRIKIKLPGMTFKPRVLTMDKNRELKWLGHLFFKGLFDGEHKFLLTKNTDGTTHFEHSETFKGVLLNLFSKKLDKDTKAGFKLMNEQLKKRAENAVAGKK